MVEVPNRLMGVNQQSERHFVQVVDPYEDAMIVPARPRGSRELIG
jgi:hypothetical protein